MGKLFKYTFRQYNATVGWSLLFTIALNLVFGIINTTGIWGKPGSILAIVLSSLNFVLVLGVVFIMNFKTINRLFKAPEGYFSYLTPVPAWKLLLCNLFSRVLLDSVNLVLSIVGIVVQSLIFVKPFGGTGRVEEVGLVLWSAVLFILGYFFLITFLFFMISFYKSIPYRIPFRRLISLVVGIIVLIVANSAFHLLRLVAHPYTYKMFTAIVIPLSFNPALVLFLLLSIGELLALFLVTSYLMERKINL